MIVLDYQDRRPIYEQVTDKFQILILNGVLPPGSQMPSVRQLATELSVNPNTIQRAYMELEKLGLIYPVKGRGNFVADSSQVQKINRELSKRIHSTDTERQKHRIQQRGTGENACGNL